MHLDHNIVLSLCVDQCFINSSDKKRTVCERLYDPMDVCADITGVGK